LPAQSESEDASSEPLGTWPEVCNCPCRSPCAAGPRFRGCIALFAARGWRLPVQWDPCGAAAASCAGLGSLAPACSCQL